jgi:hypothetical protein
LLTALLQQQSTLTQAVSTLTTAIVCPPTINILHEALEKPEQYKGKVGLDSHQFITYFQAWAASTQSCMNTQQVNRTWLAQEDMRIQTALSYMSGNAAIWVQPYLEKFFDGSAVPFCHSFMAVTGPQ